MVQNVSYCEKVLLTSPLGVRLTEQHWQWLQKYLHLEVCDPSY